MVKTTKTNLLRLFEKNFPTAVSEIGKLLYFVQQRKSDSISISGHYTFKNPYVKQAVLQQQPAQYCIAKS